MRKKIHNFIILVMIAAVFLPRFSVSAQDQLDQRVEQILQSMPLDVRVGQMFMVSFYGVGLNNTGRKFLESMQPGATAMFGSNGTSPEQINITINAWQEVARTVGAKIPMMISIDHEGGTVTRLTTGFTPLPWGAALGAMPPEQAQKVGELAALELSAVGIHMNLAPVVDVRSDPKVTFMEKRVFGADPDTVSRAANAYLAGLQSKNVIGVIKHFPGHGAAGDSHQFLPTINANREAIEKTELAPFRAAIENGAEAVMVGHLAIPSLDPENRPATLSPVIVTDLLRKELGFEGVIMTDSMDMGAIVDNYKRTDAAVLTVQAGMDMVVAGPYTPMPDQLLMKQAIIDAVNAGKIPPKQIEDSVRRILKLKAKYGILDTQPLDPANAVERVNSKAHIESLGEIYLNTVAFAKDQSGLLPLQPGVKKIAVVFPGIYPSVWRECGAIDKTAKGYAYSLNPTNGEMGAVWKLGQESDLVVIFTYNIDENLGQSDMVNMIDPTKTVVVALQNPYDIERNIAPDAYVTAFNTYPWVFKATCSVLYGQHPAVGKWTVR